MEEEIEKSMTANKKFSLWLSAISIDCWATAKPRYAAPHGQTLQESNISRRDFSFVQWIEINKFDVYCKVTLLG